ncbi:MAG: ROK family protein [Candidatus Methanodesulfokora washburnensis]
MRVLGLDIGGTFVKWAEINGKKGKIWTDRSAEGVISAIRSLIEERKPDRVGIAVAGLVDLEGRIRHSPNLRWVEGINLRDEFDAVVLNDATAAAYGEYRAGAGMSRKVVLTVTLGTGIGGGLVISGMPFVGASGVALEPGHIIINPNGKPCNCGRRGCLEAYFSSYAIERDYFELKGEKAGIEEITRRYRAGEREAVEVIRAATKYLSIGISNLIMIINPDIVVLAGGLAFDIPDLEDLLNLDLFDIQRTEVRRAELGEYSGALGAAFIASDNPGLLGTQENV